MPTNQKMARINVDDDAWTQLRMHALRVGTSVADLLGQMIRDQLAAASTAPVADAPDPAAEPEPPPPEVTPPQEEPAPPRENPQTSRARALPHDLGPDVPDDWSAYRDPKPITWIPPWEE